MKNGDIQTISQEDYQVWFNRNHDTLYHKSPYHSPAWIDAVGRGVNFETIYLGIRQNGELQTVIPGFITKKGPFTLYGSPLRGSLTSTLGPVSLRRMNNNGTFIDLFQETREYLKNTLGVDYCRFTLPGPLNQPMEELSSGWEEQRPGSYWLDLSCGIEAVWDGLKKDCRRNIRKAREFGIEIVPFDDPELHYEMVEKTYQRHGTSSWHPKGLFQNMLEELVPEGVMRAWGAKYQDEIIAACLFLYNEQQIHFISGASNPHFGNLPTSYLIHWHAIETAVREGIKTYHTNMSGVSSIDHFKESFNPELKKRYTLIWSPNHVRFAQSIYLFGSSSVRKLKSVVKTTADKVFTNDY